MYAGIFLVAGSVFAGSVIISASNNTVRMWTVRTDLSAGTVLGKSDLVAASVHLSDLKRNYFPENDKIVGQTLTRDVGKHELVPRDAVRKRLCGSVVSIPITTQHLPMTLRKGQRIDLYSSNDKGEMTTKVLEAVTVQRVTKPKSGLLATTAQWSLAVRVSDGKATEIVSALRGKQLDVTVVEATGGDTDPCGEGSEQDTRTEGDASKPEQALVTPAPSPGTSKRPA